jgi:hypothetical protein
MPGSSSILLSILKDPWLSAPRPCGLAFSGRITYNIWERYEATRNWYAILMLFPALFRLWQEGKPGRLSPACNRHLLITIHIH